MYIEIALLFLLLVLYCFVRERKPPNMPPGPFEFPFIGCGMHFFDEKPAEELKKKYGDIVSFRAVNMRVVFIFDYQVAKEVLGRPEFSGRPAFFNDFSLDPDKLGGLTNSVGVHWQHDRRFVLRNLRNLGMGKSYLEEAINTEAHALVEDLKKYEGKPINFPNSFRTSVLNIIWQMVASRRYDLRSEEVEAFYRVAREFQTLPAWTFLPSLMPILRWIPKGLRSAIFREHVVENYLATSTKHISATIGEHEKELDIDHPVDLIDEYLKGMKEQEGDEESLFRKGALLQIINDLFTAGSETGNIMLRWISFIVARFPDVAARVRDEIDTAVGKERIVSLQDKPNLPLVDAFVVECLRYSSMVVQNIHRTCPHDTTIGGYFIPKNAMVTVGNYSIHHDPRYWTEPEKFSPERHLDENGKFRLPRAGFCAFGLGRRQCVGEALARMEIFLFAAAIIQNFNIKVPEGVTLTDDCINTLGMRSPKDTLLIYEARV